MKNIFFLFKKAFLPVIIAFTLVFCQSCGKREVSAADLMFAATEALDTVPECRVFSAQSNEFESSHLTEQEFSFIYTGVSGSCQEFSVLSDYYMLFSTGISVFELHVLRASDITAVPAIEKLVCRRADLLNRYNNVAEELDLIYLSPNRAEVAVFGHWVILSVTPENQEVFSAVKSRLRE